MPIVPDLTILFLKVLPGNMSPRLELQLLLSSKGRNPVLFEGSLGKLKTLSLVEDLMLEIKAANGIIRIDITKDEIRQLIKKNPNEG